MNHDEVIEVHNKAHEDFRKHIQSLRVTKFMRACGELDRNEITVAEWQEAYRKLFEPIIT